VHFFPERPFEMHRRDDFQVRSLAGGDGRRLRLKD
jgi:hypothetical protein